MSGFDNEVMNAINWDFRGAVPVQAQATMEGQLPIGTGASPAIEVGGLTSPDGSITIGYSNPDITLQSSPTAINYTDVDNGDSPYTVLATDYFISVDSSAGVVELQFPNAPTFKQQWIVKDRTGDAAVSNITLTTPGGTVTFDGLTTYTMNSNFQAVNLLANATPTYEVY